MLVYGNFPVVKTDVVIKTLSLESEDPVRPVVCIAYDLQENMITAYGVNKMIPLFSKNSRAREVVGTPLDPAKKFLMIHSEMDLLEKMKDCHADLIKKTGIFLSLQPCMECLKALLARGFVDIQWKEDNRHQDEQELMRPFLHIIRYKKNAEGLHLQVPSWIASPYELKRHT